MLYSSMEEIDTTNCYIPFYDNDSGNITISICEILFFDDRHGSDSNIYCFDRDFLGHEGGNLFCYGKPESNEKYLIGVVSTPINRIDRCSNSDFMMTTISNLVRFKKIFLKNNNSSIH
ncbi:GSCOCG00000160001-RA-CDS [Cotesia congregata]|nr:GSCOCG00000160001-RA-CDS [Cotesia congregata]